MATTSLMPFHTCLVVSLALSAPFWIALYWWLA